MHLDIRIEKNLNKKMEKKRQKGGRGGRCFHQNGKTWCLTLVIKKSGIELFPGSACEITNLRNNSNLGIHGIKSRKTDGEDDDVDCDDGNDELNKEKRTKTINLGIEYFQPRKLKAQNIKQDYTGVKVDYATRSHKGSDSSSIKESESKVEYPRKAGGIKEIKKSVVDKMKTKNSLEHMEVNAPNNDNLKSKRQWKSELNFNGMILREIILEKKKK